jgi:asparagine synthase (glutamine-hydrolysing)
MCGIAGVFRQNGSASDADTDGVIRMTEAQRHRGPDGEGIFYDRFAVLGHRRLSILDLSEAGLQPMANEDGSIRVVCNGEIYNYPDLRRELRSHRFRSNSDTEVIVHGYEEWGLKGLLQRLRGMFAFALYDESRRCCTLVRDRLGIKPLYYAELRDGVAFASEVRSLVAGGFTAGEPDPDGLAGFLLLGSVPSPVTHVRGVRCLPPGHVLQVSPEGTKLRRYWDLREGERAELRHTLCDVVQRHLLSDVPLGVFLSGGIDSAGVVALARRRSERLQTLTVVFDEAEFSEGSQARQIARNYGTDHHEVRFTAQDFTENLPRILAAMDQPTNDGLNTWVVSKAARELGLKVVLSGLGGDELFWGYPSYRLLTRHRCLLGSIRSLPGPVRKGLARLAVIGASVAGRENWMRLAHFAAQGTAGSLYLALRGFFAPEQVCRLLGMTEREVARAVEAHAGGFDDQLSAETFNRTEIHRYLHDQLLRDSDVFSMAHSIELRVPYLDHVLVSTAMRLPASAKLFNGRNKPVLTEALSEPVIDAAAERPKRGFLFPFARWMRESPSALRELVSANRVVDRGEAGRLWAEFERGRLHWSRAWALAVTGALHARR